jgi:hypothetical protein
MAEQFVLTTGTPLASASPITAGWLHNATSSKNIGFAR